ncbi:lipoprotein insertase outer membrane protein LolB [Aquabacterium sp. A08]|uniref:lipoprotein insertase outer membrane protein LolB n=1 Tax=Aquabacterium sp. A08 TaxID=2718532 RepID=UPI00353006C3
MNPPRVLPAGRRHWLRAALALAVATLSACALPPKPPTPGMADGDAWSGRLALHIESEPAQHLSAGFELSGTPTQGELHLLSPLGQTLASAHWTPQGAWLQRGPQRRDYPDTDTLTTELTGTSLPLAPLFDWLRGQPTAVDGWTVDLTQHAQGRLRAQRQTPAPGVQLRLVFQ